MRAYAAYLRPIPTFRDEVAKSKPTTNPKQIMVAAVGPEIIDAVIAAPAINSQAFETVPSVELHLNDLKTDIATFVAKVGYTKMANPDGSWGTTPVPHVEGAVNRLVAFDEAKPGVSGAATFDAMFGGTLSRMNADYSVALSAMRQEYRSQCQGDPAEVRRLSDF